MLISDLPWTFSIEQEKGPRHRIFFKSQAEKDKTGVRLQMFLDSSNYASPEITADALSQVRSQADPDMGLSYGWDFMTIRDTRLYRLHADCTLSEDYFLVMVRALERILSISDNHRPFPLLCRCGGGCKQTDVQKQ